jgi:hypothetical protein
MNPFRVIFSLSRPFDKVQNGILSGKNGKMLLPEFSSFRLIASASRVIRQKIQLFCHFIRFGPG